MKRITLYRLLGIESIFCLFLFGLESSYPSFMSSVFAFPFEQIGRLLRIMSLSGPSGNVLALGFYFLLCSLPFFFLLKFRKQRAVQAEDLLLPVLSSLLFYILYRMINPGLAQISRQNLPAEFSGILLYSVLTGYLILRLVRRFSQATPPLLHQYLKGLILLSLALLVLTAFGIFFGELLYSIRSVRQSNTAPGLVLNPTFVFLTAGYLIRIVPYLLLIRIGMVCLDLLEAMAEDPYSLKVAESAAVIARIAQLSVVLTVSLSIGFNLVQTVLADTLHSINWTFELPFALILLSLAMLLFAQFLCKTRQIKQEHDLFI